MTGSERRYRGIGNILVFSGYFIGLTYLLMLYLLAFSIAEGMFDFWEGLVFPSWPWMVTAFLLIAVGCVFIVIDVRRRKHENIPKMEPKAARLEPVHPHVHVPAEQPVEL